MLLLLSILKTGKHGSRFAQGSAIVVAPGACFEEKTRHVQRSRHSLQSTSLSDAKAFASRFGIAEPIPRKRRLPVSRSP